MRLTAGITQAKPRAGISTTNRPRVPSTWQALTGPAIGSGPAKSSSSTATLSRETAGIEEEIAGRCFGRSRKKPFGQGVCGLLLEVGQGFHGVGVFLLLGFQFFSTSVRAVSRRNGSLRPCKPRLNAARVQTVSRRRRERPPGQTSLPAACGVHWCVAQVIAVEIIGRTRRGVFAGHDVP